MNRASINSGETSNDQIYVYLEFPQNRVGKYRRCIWRNKGQNYSIFDENYKPTYSRSITNLKHERHQSITTKLFKTSDKDKILKEAWEKRHVT